MFYYTEQFGTIVNSAKTQYRDTLNVYDPGYTPIRLLFQANVPNGQITFHDPVTNTQYLRGTGSTKTVLVPSGATLQVDGTTTLNGATTIASLNDARQGTFTYSFVYGNGSRNFSQTIQGVTVESFELALTFGHTFTANPYVHCVPVSTDYSTAGVRGVYVKSRNTTSVTFVIMLEAAIPQPTTFHWLAFRP
jgi:hypothetical protein